MNILLIDDLSINLETGKKAIEKMYPDATVEICNNFKTAMDLLVPSCKYDMVLTDLEMPICETPANNKKIGDGAYFNPKQSITYGFIIAPRAALVGVKKIAIVHDGSHHMNSVTAAVEFIMNGTNPTKEYNFPELNINGSRVLIINSEKDWDHPNHGFQLACKKLTE